MVKNPPAMQEPLRDMGSVPGSGRSPGEGTAPCFSVLGQRSLVGYSPWAHKGSDATEHAVSTWHSAAFILCLLSHQQSTSAVLTSRRGSAPAFRPPNVRCLCERLRQHDAHVERLPLGVVSKGKQQGQGNAYVRLRCVAFSCFSKRAGPACIRPCGIERSRVVPDPPQFRLPHRPVLVLPPTGTWKRSATPTRSWTCGPSACAPSWAAR